VAQHLLHGLCVSVLHGCGGPGRPRLASPRPPRLPPRTPAAGSCHRGRPGADSCPLLFLLLLLLRGGGGRFRLTGALNHPSPLPQKPPHAARPRRARPRDCEPPAPPRVWVASAAASRPRAAQAPGAAPRRRGADEERRRAEPSAPGTARQATGEELRGAPARAPQLCTPDSGGGGNCGGGDGRWRRRGRLRGGCSNSIYPPLPPLSPPPRHVDAAHWPREPPARRGRRGPAPSSGALPRARTARPRRQQAPPPPARRPPGTRIEAARGACARARGQGHLCVHAVLDALRPPARAEGEPDFSGATAFPVSTARGDRARSSRVGALCWLPCR
jgi:hypothetical protein